MSSKKRLTGKSEVEMRSWCRCVIVLSGILLSANVMAQKRGMIVLKDSIEIHTTIDSMYHWFLNLDKNFVRWDSVHHTDFKLLSGGTNVGDEIYFEEVVDGVKYAVKGKIIEKAKSDNEFVFAFKTSSGMGHIYFIGKKQGDTVRFIHVEKFGLKTPVIGNAINFLIFKVIAKKKANWDLILNDMKEDNIRLKKLIESKQ